MPALNKDGRPRKFNHSYSNVLTLKGMLPTFEDAACRDLDLTVFFNDDRAHDKNNTAIKICNSCFERYECLTFALAEEMEFGVWGGIAPKERGTLRRKLGIRNGTKVSTATVRRLLAESRGDLEDSSGEAEHKWIPTPRKASRFS